MAARSFGCDNSALGRTFFEQRLGNLALIAWREVRSLMPISTLPLPIGMTSSAYVRISASVSSGATGMATIKF